MSPAARREVVGYLRETWALSERRACRLSRLARGTWRYRQRRPGDGDLRRRLLDLAARYPRYRYELLYLKLRREGVRANHKRVLRLYREERLTLRGRSRRKGVVPFAVEVRVSDGVQVGGYYAA